MSTIRQAQLIKTETKTVYLKDDKIIDVPETEQEKLAHQIFGQTKVIRSETVIERWRIKTQKEAEKKFWDWCEENKADFRDYYLVFTE